MEHYNKAFQNLEHPFAWLDLDALNHNIDYVNKSCGDKQVRVATKSIRSLEALQLIAKRLNHFAGYMTFTASESLFLFEKGLDQLLIGYPVYEEPAILKLAQWVKKGKSLTFMIDHVQQAALLNTIARKVGVTLNICVDINVSTDFKVLYFGSKRSPITDFAKLDDLLRQLKTLPYLQITGVMAYDAQIAGVADQTPNYFGAKGALIRTLKKQSVQKITSLRQFAVAHVKSMADVKFVNAGGSGSMTWCSEERDVTEITVGSAFLAPALFDHYESLQLQPAAGFALRVTRQFSPDTFVCHGGGYAASGAAGIDRLPVFLQPERFALLPLEGAGEVQTPIHVKQGSLTIGDTVYMRHAKAGELCERFQVLHIIEGGHYKGPMKTYRGENQCFL